MAIQREDPNENSFMTSHKIKNKRSDKVNQMNANGIKENEISLLEISTHFPNADYPDPQWKEFILNDTVRWISNTQR